MEKEKLIALVKKSQSGDAEAMEELLQFAHTSVSYQCRKMLKNAQDAEDMTQEVLVTIYTKLDTLQDPAAFQKWANQITASRCINALNRSRVEYQFAEDEEGHSILDNLEDLDAQRIPDKVIDNAETARMIGQIVENLPDAQRAATLMFYYDEMSVKEIAMAMGVSENTVKSRLNYARKTIKDQVLDYEKQGIKLYGLSPLPFLLYFLRLAADLQKDKAAAGIMAAEVMAAEGTAVGIAAGAGSAGAAASLFLKAAAAIVAAAITLTGVAAVVIPKTGETRRDPSPVPTGIPSVTEKETIPETRAPTEAATVPVETEPEDVTEAPEDTGAANPAVGEHDHDYVVTEYVPHTCTTGGWTTAVCTICGDTVTQYRSALWYHVYVDGVCTYCGVAESTLQDTCQHQYDSGVEQWPAGTMTWDPYILYTCKLCGHTYTELIDLPY